jgi:hypothetical protein
MNSIEFAVALVEQAPRRSRIIQRAADNVKV